MLDSLNSMRIWTLAAILVIASLALYSRSIRNDFVWDAESVFALDPSIRDIHYLPGYFREGFHAHLSVEGTQGRLTYYRPLTKVLHLLEYRVFGANPAGYNAVNLLLNAGSVVLAFFLVEALTGNRTAAFLAALLYAVNPTRVEAVSWAYSDSYLIVALLSFLSLLLYHRGRRALAAGVFFASLFFHESAILLAPVILLYALLLSNEKHPRRLLRTAPFFLLGALFLAIRTVIIGSIPISRVDPAAWFNTSAVVVMRYVKIFFVPDALITIYPAQLFRQATGEVVAGYATLLALAAFGVLLWRKHRALLFWYLWFFLWLALSLNIGQFGNYLMADKLLNTASLGFCVLLALWPVSVGWSRTAASTMLAVLVLFHATTTFARTRYWTDTVTYLEKALAFSPNFAIALDRLGTGYYERGDVERAIEMYRRAAVSAPSWSQPHHNLATMYTKKGDLDLAEQELRLAIRYDPRNPKLFYQLGMVMEEKGDVREAIDLYRRLLSLEPYPPKEVMERINSAVARARRGR